MNSRVELNKYKYDEGTIYHNLPMTCFVVMKTAYGQRLDNNHVDMLCAEFKRNPHV